MFFSLTKNITTKVLGSMVVNSAFGHITGAVAAPIARQCFTGVLGLASGYTGELVTETLCEALGNCVYDYANDIGTSAHRYVSDRLRSPTSDKPEIETTSQQAALLFHFDLEKNHEKQMQEDQDYAIALSLMENENNDHMDLDYALAVSLSQHDIQQDADFALALETEQEFTANSPRLSLF